MPPDHILTSHRRPADAGTQRLSSHDTGFLRRPGFLCDLAPAQGFGGDKYCEVFRGPARHDVYSATGKALFYLRQVHRRKQRGMELVDDRPRRTRRNEYALPRAADHLGISRFDHRRHLWQGFDSFACRDAERFESAGLDEADRRRQRHEHDLRFATEHPGDGGAGTAFVRDVHDIEIGELHEPLHFQTVQRARSGRSEVELARLRLRQRHELGDGIRRDAGVGDQDARDFRDQRDRDEILLRVDRQILKDRRIDRDRTDVAKVDRIAIGRCLCGCFHADVARCARPILDHDLLPERFAQLRRNDARHEVGRAARGERDDHLDGMVGVGRLCGRKRRKQHQRQHEQGPRRHLPHDPPSSLL